MDNDGTILVHLSKAMERQNVEALMYVSTLLAGSFSRKVSFFSNSRIHSGICPVIK